MRIPFITRRRIAREVARLEARRWQAVLSTAGKLEDFPSEAARYFSCSEADALVNLFQALGLWDLAENFLQDHALSDTEEDDAHHDEYVFLTDRLTNA
jgi:IS4 transposase